MFGDWLRDGGGFRETVVFIMVIIGGSAAGYTCWVGADVVVVGLYGGSGAVCIK